MTAKKSEAIVEPSSDKLFDQQERTLAVHTGLEPYGKSILDMGPKALRNRLKKLTENRRIFLAWVAENLVEGIDYGRFHRRYPLGKARMNDQGGECKEYDRCETAWHWTKPTLLKPGAEKIAGMLVLVPSWPGLRDYELAGAQGVRIQHIVLRCLLLKSGQIVGEGVGGRTLVSGDLNKALKMAKKSALIDGVLVTGGLSEIFTQDLDEFREGEQTDLVDEAELCPIGPWKNRPLRDLTDEQLDKVLELSDDAELRDRIKSIMAGREDGEDSRPDDASAPAAREVTLDACTAALRGATSLAALEKAWETLPPRFSRSLAGFRKQREEELS